MKHALGTAFALAAGASIVASCSGSGGNGGAPSIEDGGRDGAPADASSAPEADALADVVSDAAADTAVASEAGDGPADVASPDASPDASCNPGPNEDADGDGFTIAQGDCNDCDPLVNPGAVDVLHTPADGGAPYYTDDDCDGTAGDVGMCDTGLALSDVSAMDGAEAIDLCRAATASGRTWGVLSAGYTRADGSTFAPGLQVGIESTFGPNVSPRAGASMLLLSSGHARTPSQPGACGSDSCSANAGGTPPSGFPQAVSGCPTPSSINDDVSLSVTLRVPTNATGYTFDFRFYTFDYPQGVCTAFDDQFIALANPAPSGSINGNLAFDSRNDPVSANMSITSCDASTAGTFAHDCTVATCPSVPDPYCPAGTGQLAGTGFDVWGVNTSSTFGGAAPWLRTQAPATPGSQLALRFILWDSGDQTSDSSVLIDNFRWITSGAVAVGTAVAP
jgi:hypothetical protein